MSQRLVVGGSARCHTLWLRAWLLMNGVGDVKGGWATNPGTVMVVELAAVDADWAALVGGKAAGLGELIMAGERVPEGFCVTTAAYDAVRGGGGVVPDELRREIVAAYGRLGADVVAVRSSATAEDLLQASPASTTRS